MGCLVISRSYWGHCDNFKKLGQGSWTDGLLMNMVLCVTYMQYLLFFYKKRVYHEKFFSTGDKRDITYNHEPPYKIINLFWCKNYLMRPSHKTPLVPIPYVNSMHVNFTKKMSLEITSLFYEW